MINISTDSNLSLPVVTLDGAQITGITGFELKYVTKKGKSRGVKFKVTLLTPEIHEGTPKFVAKTYIISNPIEGESEEVTQERADSLAKIQELSDFWARNGATIQTPKKADVEISVASL